MIFQQRDRSVIDIYLCPICQSYYTRNNSNMSCCVNHAPGSCCHFNEIEVSKNKIDKIKKILRESE